jgi:hypothetical protein
VIGTTVLGLLGWSNKRSGVEFYRYDPKIIPRHSSEWGELLANEQGVKDMEGSPVIVLVLPRGTSEDDTRAIELLVRAATVDRVLSPPPGERAAPQEASDKKPSDAGAAEA